MFLKWAPWALTSPEDAAAMERLQLMRVLASPKTGFWGI